MKKSGHMVLKGVIFAQNAKAGQMVLKGVNWVNWVHNVKIRSYGLVEGSIWYRMHKIKSNGVERSQSG